MSSGSDSGFGPVLMHNTLDKGGNLWQSVCYKMSSLPGEYWKRQCVGFIPRKHLICFSPQKAFDMLPLHLDLSEIVQSLALNNWRLPFWMSPGGGGGITETLLGWAKPAILCSANLSLTARSPGSRTVGMPHKDKLELEVQRGQGRSSTGRSTQSEGLAQKTDQGPKGGQNAPGN